MGRPGVQMWTWTLFVCLSWMCVDQAVAGPQYMVAIPAVIEAGAETPFCATLLKPNETLVMTVTLRSQEQNMTLMEETSSQEFHTCIKFQAPLVHNQVQKLEVEVRGQTFYSKEVRKVMFRTYKSSTFVQTDKPIYLPGQTVQFRVISLDSKFRPVNQSYNVIELEDSVSNRIGQWMMKSSDGKILQLSYSLNSEAREGTYNVIVQMGEQKIRHSFKVEKYVLPRFEVKIETPETVSIGQEDIKAQICAKYTYGQPVPGNVKIELLRPFKRIRYMIPIFPGGTPDILSFSYREIQQADKSGCSTFVIKMSNFTEPKVRLLHDILLHDSLLHDSLHLTASVEEEGTGISHQSQKRLEITYVIGKFIFMDTPKFYEQGSVVEGKVKAVRYDGTPIANMVVYLLEGSRWSLRLLQNVTTDSEGIANFSISTAEINRDIQLTASSKPHNVHENHQTPFYQSGEHTVSQIKPLTQETKTISSLEVQKKDRTLACDTEEDLHIKFFVVGEAQGKADVMYLVLSRGAIVMQGSKQIEVQDKPMTEGQMSFKLRVSPEIAPVVQVVAYAVLPSETVIAHSAEFTTEKCFSHKVSLEFSPSSAVPGEENTLQVTAHPDSLCGLSAVDQSVLIKEPGKTLTVDKIFDLLPVTKSTSIPNAAEDPFGCLQMRSRRSIVPYSRRSTTDDAYKVFQNVGLKMATNLFIRMPSCVTFRGQIFRQEYDHNPYRSSTYRKRIGLHGFPGKMPKKIEVEIEAALVETVRSFFPETWIWDLVEVGASGTKVIPLTVPDTITTWETEAFCLSPQGFGLAPRKELTVFQPFFLELSLPYSIIRGENFELKATVFNYLSSCIMVTMTPTPSLDYTLTPLSGDQYTSCLCGNERKTLSWIMAPAALGDVNVTMTAEAVASHASCNNEIVNVPERGRIDVVTKSLIVKAEGTEMTKTHNWLLCPKDEALTEEINIQLPANVIDGSARALVSVLGDILGRALKNLDGLLRMPYGCGEQNMALLAPNIYILQYLKNTQQLTPKIMDKSANFLTSGYQRQLNYKHAGGAYSTFGTGSGNTWLTAFVVRSFAKAQSFVFIDPVKIQESKTWLESKQREQGCFEKSGKLFNNRMKGGVSDEVTLTAYIIAGFLEMNTSVSNPVVSNGLSCLKASLGDLSNTYATALMAYVFTLAGDLETRGQLLRHLDTVAIRSGGYLHWSQSATDTSYPLSVEISSYVLLSVLSVSPSAEELGYSTGIVRWLTTQQNYYGGFSSTQDTVVALQALALYSTRVFSPEGSSTVAVQSPSGQLMFDVNQDNKLLYQEELLKDGTGKYSLEVKGTSCASIQISLHYNIPTPTDGTKLRVEVQPEALCGGTSNRRKLTLKTKTLYYGEEPTTNMVILDLKMLSGFIPNPESLKKLKGALLVDRVEQNKDHVLVYLKELPKDITIDLELELIQEIQVQNLKPAVVNIYDYYQPNDLAETQYTDPCSTA
ncbi:murinoglobulin-1-like [Notolabrus celidotus]|uniref:murinoglobulin-1-like n=1 Tax=Notolabrus celidotus TaxID=1203425 RepID=UPI00149057A2|nr:murinoglobulin-1-like [Notolabrus celidotus]